ncbi:heavy metal transporter [Bordetella flabilis]|uniref:Heavy metal transporter n=2 Tax=Bordetella flabilis TaxID=463014 RepID=A0A193GKY6_9BORD|nr:heavy-metal-associated domain-containing protein [Bordetella flabilis]ANN80525.1 heavy metal transporter [Bordetella flabilis]
MVLQYHVPDMSCDHCVKVIGEAVSQAVEGATVQADLRSHTVRVAGTEDKTAVEAAIRSAGYTPAAV